MTDSFSGTRQSRGASYPVGQQLAHHSGATWEVIESGLPGDGKTWSEGMLLCEGDYRIQGVGASGAATGRTMRVHADYLHGDGWRRLDAVQ